MFYDTQLPDVHPKNSYCSEALPKSIIMLLRLTIATFTTAYCWGALTQTPEGKVGGGGGMADQHGGELLKVSKKTWFELAGVRWNSKQKIVKYSYRNKEDGWVNDRTKSIKYCLPWASLNSQN